MERRLVYIFLHVVLSSLYIYDMPLVIYQQCFGVGVLGTAYQVCDDWQTVSWRFFWRDNSPQRLSHAMFSYHRHSCPDRYHFYTRRLRYVWSRGVGWDERGYAFLLANWTTCVLFDVIFFILVALVSIKLQRLSMEEFYISQLNRGGERGSSLLRPPLNPFRNRFSFTSKWYGDAGLAQWWERLPPTAVARVRFPDLVSHVGWVCCWFSSLLQGFFFGFSGFPPSSKTNTPNSNSIWEWGPQVCQLCC